MIRNISMPCLALWGLRVSGLKFNHKSFGLKNNQFRALWRGLFFALTAIGCACSLAQAQANEWTWMGGSEHIGQPGVYGTLGTPAAGNMPGCRANATTSTDSSGHIWLFGGQGCDASGAGGASLNDLWEFDPSRNEWTWWSGSSTVSCTAQPCGVQGVYGTLGTPAAGNVPGGRISASSWVDKSGNFWLFGGEGFDANGNNWNLNDLWEFNPSANQWVWMGGSETSSGFGNRGVYGVQGASAATNVPGSRYYANSWTDGGGHFWLFGGYGTDSITNDGPLNDLWEFDPSTKEWTWIGGSSSLASFGTGNPGVYGSLGVAAAGNTPGGRYFASSWTDREGHFWLFGGNGSPSNAGTFYLNDLWEFDPSTREWTWMGGSGTIDPFSSGVIGVYGILGVPDPQNAPGSREYPAGWADSSGNLWLFGGFGIFGSHLGDLAYFNDLWEFSSSHNEWAWTGGSNTVPGADGGNIGTYGVPGVPAPGNVPGSRYGAANWTDSNGNLWLFGGLGADANGNFGFLNDLWVYQAPSAVLPTAATPTFSVLSGTYIAAQTVTISDATSNATIYYTIDGTTPSTSSTGYSGPITVSSTETLQAIATASGYATSAVASATYTINLPPPSFSFAASPTSLTVKSGGTGTIALTVTPQNGFKSAVGFACSGLPAGATCTFNPATVTPTGSAVTTTLTISTAAKSAELEHKGWPNWPATTLALTGLVFVRKKHRRVASLMALIVLATGIGAVTACGGGGGGGSVTPTPTPTPTTSTVTVTATSGALQQPVNLSLTVN